MTSSIVYDVDIYKEFEKIVGAGNVSDEIRAFMRDMVEQEKKEEGLNNNPLNLKLFVNTKNNYGQDNNKPSVLFEYFEIKDQRDNIRLYINNISNIEKLQTLYNNCNAVIKMINTRKNLNHAEAMARERKEHNEINIPSEQIVNEIKKQKRREFSVRRV